MHSRAALFETHAGLLANRARFAAFERAIASAVKPGAVVVDLAAGIGMLSLLACRAGAGRVIAIESGEAGDLAKKVIAANGVADRVELIRADSWCVVPSELADVVVADLFYDGFHAKGVGQLIDAQTRMLRGGGVLLPNRVQVVAAPVEAPREHAARISFWDQLYGCDYSSLQSVAAGLPGPAKLAASSMAAPARVLIDLDLSKPPNLQLTGRTSFEFGKRATVHGLGFWLRTELDGACSISDDPLEEQTGQTQRFVPFRDVIEVNALHEMTVEVSLDDQDAWDWNISLGSRGGENRRAVHSTLRRRDREDARGPRALELLGAKRSVLAALEAGPRTARDLTNVLIASHGSVFPTKRAAEELVAELLRRFAQTSKLAP